MFMSTVKPSRSSDKSTPRSSPSRGAKAFIGAAGLGLVAALSIAAVRDDDHSPAAADGVEVGHIHGIGVDPADGQLYIGAHLGTFGVDDDGAVEPVGAVRNDTMAFTVTGPGRFLASGHPEPGSDQPVHLGLIESSDAATSWQPVSLAGLADFHAIDVGAEGRTWAADSARGLLLTSTDFAEWDVVARGSFIDVAVDPAGDDSALATTGAGELRSYDAAGEVVPVPGAPTLTFLDRSEQGWIVGLDPSGRVMVSTDDAGTWDGSGQVPGQPSALEVSEKGWYAASDRGLFFSDDSGSTWDPLFTYGDTP
jgi:photosystem II stability/assembly factor-like uncharacterized protein